MLLARSGHPREDFDVTVHVPARVPVLVRGAMVRAAVKTRDPIAADLLGRQVTEDRVRRRRPPRAPGAQSPRRWRLPQPVARAATPQSVLERAYRTPHLWAAKCFTNNSESVPLVIPSVAVQREWVHAISVTWVDMDLAPVPLRQSNGAGLSARRNAPPGAPRRQIIPNPAIIGCADECTATKSAAIACLARSSGHGLFTAVAASCHGRWTPATR